MNGPLKHLLQKRKTKQKNKTKKKKNKKNYNYSIFAILNNDKVLVRYSSRINESLRRLFKYQEQDNKEGNYKMNEIGLGKNKKKRCDFSCSNRLSYCKLCQIEY